MDYRKLANERWNEFKKRFPKITKKYMSEFGGYEKSWIHGVLNSRKCHSKTLRKETYESFCEVLNRYERMRGYEL